MMKNPQIHTDEHRAISVKVFVADLDRLIHSKERKSWQYLRPAMEKQHQYRTRITRVRWIFTDLFKITDIFNPCASVSSAQSVFYLNCSPANRVSAFICVHLRLIFGKGMRGGLA
ncbi:hypothetical protein ANME2D_03094 [Candidatus Methanoperedens nitroreducens]|uniref:Uncharacterized protein n=1 Tax=Candidatus Methanoperedens nitratireducens TaxID=1392998 RepID=A0A062V5J4_9EURY|nr:hypothetical protein ANME2D_03094 [Candidatus Methanoperedens nitroreducens]